MIRTLSVLLTIFIILCAVPANSCSMFKITLYGKTMAGNNEDTWTENAAIWFEKGGEGRYGAAYVGHRELFPQGGINEAGLTFDGFTVYPRPLRTTSGKKPIDNPSSFIKAIMQQCKTVADVKALVYQYDRHIFNNGVFLFVDSTGEYLVMEADTLITGNDQKYIISNFCPSTVNDVNDVNIARYQRGRAFLSHHTDTTLAFCRAVMDTMHECRNKIGDGTTYTTIYDLKERIIHLYFYHDFHHEVTFNLMEELKKGNHLLSIPTLFQPNREYLRFLHFKTPFNCVFVKRFIHLLEILLALLTLYWIVYSIKTLLSRKSCRRVNYGIWLLMVINTGLAGYLFILLNNQPIFYFDAPYYIPGKTVLNITAYIPVMLLMLIVPVGLINIRIINRPAITILTRRLFTINTIIYLIALLLFAYWGLLCVIQG